jgi:hypothetical protein
MSLSAIPVALTAGGSERDIVPDHDIAEDEGLLGGGWNNAESGSCSSSLILINAFVDKLYSRSSWTVKLSAFQPSSNLTVAGPLAVAYPKWSTRISGQRVEAGDGRSESVTLAFCTLSPSSLFFMNCEPSVMSCLSC